VREATMRTIQRRIVTAYVLSVDDMLLLGMKDPAGGGVYVDSWHNPGGGVEAGETDEQAIIREIREETGIDATSSDIHMVDNKATGEAVKTLPSGETVVAKMDIVVYKVVLPKTAVEIPLAPTDDLVKLQWFPVRDIHDINMTPPAKVLLSRIGTSWLYTDNV
jgi:(d)CTP diphosphatase